MIGKEVNSHASNSNNCDGMTFSPGGLISDESAIMWAYFENLVFSRYLEPLCIYRCWIVIENIVYFVAANATKSDLDFAKTKIERSDQKGSKNLKNKREERHEIVI